MKSSLVLLVILLFIALSISEDQDLDSNSEENLSESQEDNRYLLHAESSERLLGIMQQISSVANSQNSEEVRFTEENVADLIEAVEELLFYAELMSIKIPASQLEESKSVIFSAMASKLYNEALNIQQLTKNYDQDVIDYSQENLINEAFNRLSQTCAACHQLFRDN